MNIVIERLKERADGTIVNLRREIPYSTAERLTIGKGGPGESTLAIYAMVWAGCDHSRVMEDGRMVWESSFDSTTVYLEAAE
jgi:hypothetical protein